MSKRAAAVQAGGWSQEQSGDLKEAGKLWECLLAGIAWMGLKNKVQSVSWGWILLGSSVEASACSYTILKKKTEFFCCCLFVLCLFVELKGHGLSVTEQWLHDSQRMKLANIKQDCIPLPRLKIPLTHATRTQHVSQVFLFTFDMNIWIYYIDSDSGVSPLHGWTIMMDLLISGVEIHW